MTEGQVPCHPVPPSPASKYVAEERLIVHFLKRGRKMLNAGELKEPRLSMFKELLALSEQYERKNQWR